MKNILIFGLLFFPACKERPNYVLVHADGKDFPMQNYERLAIGDSCFVQYRNEIYRYGPYTEVTMCSKLDSAWSNCKGLAEGESCTSYSYSSGKIVGKCEYADLPVDPEVRLQDELREQWQDEHPGEDYNKRFSDEE